MYTSATQEYAAAAHLPFLRPIPRVMFWVALAAWLVPKIGVARAYWASTLIVGVLLVVYARQTAFWSAAAPSLAR